MFLRYIILQLFCSNNLGHSGVISHAESFVPSTFRNMCAVPNMAVFCSSMTFRFHDMLLRYFWMILRRFQVPYYNWYNLVFFIPHTLYCYCTSLYSGIFSTSFLITFLCKEIIIIIIVVVVVVVVIIIICLRKTSSSENKKFQLHIELKGQFLCLSFDLKTNIFGCIINTLRTGDADLRF